MSSEPAAEANARETARRKRRRRVGLGLALLILVTLALANPLGRSGPDKRTDKVLSATTSRLSTAALPAPTETATPTASSTRVSATATTAPPQVSPTVAPREQIATPSLAATTTPLPTATPPPPAALPPVNARWAAFEAEMLAAHNAARAAAGRQALALDASLTSVARLRAADMARSRRLSHTSANGDTAFTLLAEASVSLQAAAENIARNSYPDADSVAVAMDGFLRSGGHRDNILSADFSRIGIAAAVAGGFKYFAVVFVGP